MDTPKLTDSQNIPMNMENKASNTTPNACAFCGSNDYMKTFSQANCFRTFYPGIPSSKQPEDCEDNFTIHQPIFSSPPFLPSFHNSPVPQNVCFGHNTAGAISPGPNASSEEKRKENNPNTTDKKTESTKPNCEVKNKNVVVESGVPLPAQYFNPYFQGCSCNSSIPWTCNPFIVPIISYYVLWNSQRANLNSSNQNSCSKNENEKTNGGQNNAVLTVNGLKNPNLIVNKGKIATEKGTQETILIEGEGNNKNELKIYLNASRTSNTETAENKEEKIIDLNEEKADVSENESLNVENISSSITQFPNVTNFNESEVRNNNFYDETKEIILSKSYKAGEFEFTSTTDVSSSSLRESFEKSQHDILISNEESENSSTEIFSIQERVPSIKLIKNFTMTDQTKNEFAEECSTSTPTSIAAGDLGGENCVGYKVSIMELEREQENKIDEPKETKQPKVSLPKIGKKIQKTLDIESSKLPQTKAQQSSKPRPTTKTSSYSYSKNIKSESLASTKREISKKPILSKTKHSCLTQTNKKETAQNILKLTKAKNHKEVLTGTAKSSIRTKTAINK